MTETCRSAAFISLGVDILFLPSTVTEFSLRKKEQISLNRLIENFNLDNLYSKPKCQVVSNAFLIFKNTAAVDMLLLKFNEFPACMCVRFVFILHYLFPR
jgi:hypothetical protein